MAQKPGYSAAWAGWVTFGACVLLVLGVINIFQGIAALVSEGYFLTTSGDLLVWSFTTWGVILVIFGALQVLVGLGLLTGKEWARWTAMVLVMLNIIAQIGFLAAYPVWTSIVIALDVFVMYALTARWDAAQGTAREADWEEREWESAGRGARQTATTAPPSSRTSPTTPGTPGAQGTRPPGSGMPPHGGPGTGGTGTGTGGTDPTGIA